MEAREKETVGEANVFFVPQINYLLSFFRVYGCDRGLEYVLLARNFSHAQHEFPALCNHQTYHLDFLEKKKKKNQERNDWEEGFSYKLNKLTVSPDFFAHLHFGFPHPPNCLIGIGLLGPQKPGLTLGH